MHGCMLFFRNNLLYTFLLSIALLVSNMPILAQGELVAPPTEEQVEEIEVTSEGVSPFSLGASIGASVGINTVAPPSGHKSYPVVSGIPEVTVHPRYLVNSLYSLQAMLDVGFVHSTFAMHPIAPVNDSTRVANRLSYLCFTPGIQSKFFYAGIGIGIPVDAHRYALDGSFQTRSILLNDTLFSVPIKEVLSTMVQLRAGVHIPMLEEQHGTLCLLFNVAYTIGGSYAQWSSISNALYPSAVSKEKRENAESKYNPIPIQATLGFSFFLR